MKEDYSSKHKKTVTTTTENINILGYKGRLHDVFPIKFSIKGFMIAVGSIPILIRILIGIRDTFLGYIW